MMIESEKLKKRLLAEIRIHDSLRLEREGEARSRQEAKVIMARSILDFVVEIEDDEMEAMAKAAGQG